MGHPSTFGRAKLTPLYRLRKEVKSVKGAGFQPVQDAIENDRPLRAALPPEFADLPA
jgi:hypothetical protein